MDVSTPKRCHVRSGITCARRRPCCCCAGVPAPPSACCCPLLLPGLTLKLAWLTKRRTFSPSALVAGALAVMARCTDAGSCVLARLGCSQL